MIGRVPRSYAEVAYDAFWVAALRENTTAGTKDINSLRKTFLQIANSYTGITGNTSLPDKCKVHENFRALRGESKYPLNLARIQSPLHIAA
jgi:hypothetical protein